MADKNKELSHNLSLIFKTSIIVLISLFLARLLGYAYRIIIARYFGPEVYGLFSLALVIYSFFVVVSLMGLADGVLRYVSLSRGRKEYNKVNYLYRLSLKILSISALMSALLLFLLADTISVKIFHNPLLSIYLKGFSIMIPLSVFSSLFLSFIRAFENIGWTSFIQNILQNIAKLVFLIVLAILGFSQGAIIGSYMLGVLIMLIASYVVFRHKLSRYLVKTALNDADRRNLIKSLVSYSWPIVFLSVAGILLYWIDSFSIGYFKSASEVGIYNAAVLIVGLFDMGISIFLQLLFPLITKEYSRGNMGLISNLSKQVGKWTFIINLPLFCIFFFFPGAVINLFFGSSYLSASIALRILSVGALAYSVLSVSNNLLLMSGKSRRILVNIAIFAVLNALLCFILVPIYGMNGAAFSTSLCYSGLSLAFVIQARQRLGIIPVRRKMANVALAGVLPLILLLFLKSFMVINTFSLIVLSVLFVILYLALLFVFKGFDNEDILILKSMKRKIIALSGIQLRE